MMKLDETTNISLRDYFATAAMQGQIASGEADEILEESDSDWVETIAETAYIVADAMLKARKTPT